MNRKSGQTILLVEDDDAVRNSLGAILQMQGYNVLLAGDGEKALEVASKSKITIDLLIADIVMPKRSGVDLANLLQQQQPGMKVLFITGYSQEMAIKTLNLPENSNFIQKPSTMDSLLQKVKALLTEFH